MATKPAAKAAPAPKAAATTPVPAGAFTMLNTTNAKQSISALGLQFAQDMGVAY
jgi:hypothetical protein